jgi:hypothetical protein
MLFRNRLYIPQNGERLHKYDVVYMYDIWDDNTYYHPDIYVCLKEGLDSKFWNGSGT